MYTVRDMVIVPTVSYQKKLDQLATDLFVHIRQDIKNNINPYAVINSYFKTNSTGYKLLDSEWKSVCGDLHHIKPGMGKEVSSILIKSMTIKGKGEYTLDAFIEREFNFNIHYKGGNFMNYTYDKLLKLARVAVGLLFAKYEEVYYFEIQTVVMRVLFTYFRVVGGDDVEQAVFTGIHEPYWIVKYEDLDPIVSEILETDMSGLAALMSRELNINIKIREPKIKQIQKRKKVKAETREDLLVYIDPNMKRYEKYKLMRENFSGYEGQSPKTLSAELKKFGLNHPYHRRTLKDVEDTVIECADNINANIDHSTAVIKDEINKSTEIINSGVNDIKNKMDGIVSNSVPNKLVSMFCLTKDYKLITENIYVEPNSVEKCHNISNTNREMFFKMSNELESYKELLENTKSELDLLKSRLGDDCGTNNNDKQKIDYLIGLLNQNHIPYDLNSLDNSNTNIDDTPNTENSGISLNLSDILRGIV